MMSSSHGENHSLLQQQKVLDTTRKQRAPRVYVYGWFYPAVPLLAGCSRFFPLFPWRCTALSLLLESHLASWSCGPSVACLCGRKSASYATDVCTYANVCVFVQMHCLLVPRGLYLPISVSSCFERGITSPPRDRMYPLRHPIYRHPTHCMAMVTVNTLWTKSEKKPPSFLRSQHDCPLSLCFLSRRHFLS